MKAFVLATVATLASFSLALPVTEDTYKLHKMMKRTSCGGDPCLRDDASALIRNLYDGDTNVISVDAGTRVIASYGSCDLYGSATNGQTSSYSRDVAAGAESIFNDCLDDTGMVSGSNTAGGNGNFYIVLAAS